MMGRILLFLCVVFLREPIGAEPRLLTDASGRQIEAELVAHSGDKIVIRRGGQKFTVPVTAFAPPDQAYIRGWIEAHPDAIDFNYQFRFYADVKSTKGVGKKEGYSEDTVKFTDNLYRIVVYNNGDTEILGVEIRYEIYVADYVVMKDNRYTRLAYGAERAESLEVIAGVEKNKTIPVKGRFEFAREFRTESYIDRDWGKTDATAQDKVIGVKIRVYKGNEMLAEFTKAEDSNRMGKTTWQDKAPGEQER